MNRDDEIREGLHAVPMPTDLVPAEGFADEALRRRARSSSTRTIAAVVAVVAVLAGGTAFINGGDRVPPADPAPSASSTTLPYDSVPHPGGGPRVIGSLGSPDGSALLDLRTGEYRYVPFPTVTSPDGRYVTVLSARGLGFAEREHYLDEGEAALTWVTDSSVTAFDLGGGNWSPDGTKILGGTNVEMPDPLDPGGTTSGRDSLTSHDITTGENRVTPVPTDIKVTSIAWAPDSQGYLIAEDRAEGPSVLRTLSADGVLGEPVETDGDWYINLLGVSPGGKSLLYHYELIAEDGTSTDRVAVMDMATWATTLTLDNVGTDLVPPGEVVGWADADTFVLQKYSHKLWNSSVELVDATDGEVLKTFPWGYETDIGDLDSSAGLPPDAADLGF